ncbi:hypothetical protein I314_05523 [Cryptococcus bacillisporus CA1873]|uniref:Uncharacterized protein n=2 Tax=Cryptococcus gattii TaxID=552467 RepID=A0A0D0VYT8_CRYGA|nr:hypothetical protein I312_00461 [Cryptococcus bacillisporus CA1280]KIR58684.1 hypothetical protein I314_05523 [Cryptococcus bacillisporus CA1873]|eukprot:KIR58684.1 hypothetical protein I314_05523 [Cryptococcus gattii CA1873]
MVNLQSKLKSAIRIMKSSFRDLELLALPFSRNGVTTTGEISLKLRWMVGSAKSSQML